MQHILRAIDFCGVDTLQHNTQHLAILFPPSPECFNLIGRFGVSTAPYQSVMPGLSAEEYMAQQQEMLAQQLSHQGKHNHYHARVRTTDHARVRTPDRIDSAEV